MPVHAEAPLYLPISLCEYADSPLYIHKINEQYSPLPSWLVSLAMLRQQVDSIHLITQPVTQHLVSSRHIKYLKFIIIVYLTIQ